MEDGFGRATGFDPRHLTQDYVYPRLTPRQIQAWREANELQGRDLMRQELQKSEEVGDVIHRYQDWVAAQLRIEGLSHALHNAFEQLLRLL